MINLEIGHKNMIRYLVTGDTFVPLIAVCI